MDLAWIEELFVSLAGTSPVMQGLLGGLVITLLNSIGALAILVWRNPSEKFLDVSLGFAAGVMLTASFTSLILPGIDVGGLLPVVMGMMLGVIMMIVADRFVPHRHEVLGQEERPKSGMRAVWLFIIAITLHNMPEGLAVGVGFGSGDIPNALSLMFAIGIQNIPEGLAVSIAALNAGMGAYFYAGFVGIRAGLVEIPLAVVGAWAVVLATGMLPYAMGFAAGAMLYVISDEIIPETHRKGHEQAATLGTMLGIIVMLTLDVALG